MGAGNVDLTIDQGEDWTVQLYWTDYYDDPYPVVPPMRMEIKSTFGQPVAELVAPDTAPPAGELAPIEYNTTTGWVQLHLDATMTNAMPAGIYGYDLFVHVDSGDYLVNGQSQNWYQAVRLVTGQVTVNKRITSNI